MDLNQAKVIDQVDEKAIVDLASELIKIPSFKLEETPVATFLACSSFCFADSTSLNEACTSRGALTLLSWIKSIASPISYLSTSPCSFVLDSISISCRPKVMTSSTVRSPTTSRMMDSEASRRVSSGLRTLKRNSIASLMWYCTTHSTRATLLSPVTIDLSDSWMFLLED